MKKFLLSILMIALLSVQGFASVAENLDEMGLLLKKLTIVTGMLISVDYTVAHANIDRLQSKGEYTESRTMYTGNTYKIIGVGSEGITDLDIVILDENGNEIKKDSKIDNVPEVTFTVPQTGKYIVKAIAYNTTEDAKYKSNLFCFVVAYK